MRLAASLLLLTAACAAPSTDDQVFAPGLSRYEHLFHNAPANGSLPGLGKDDGSYPAKSTELLATQSPVKDQNERGVCSIFATTGLMEHLYLAAGAAHPSFSEQYLQWAVKVQLGELPDSEGSDIASNVDAIHQFGIVSEADDPYVGTEWSAANDPQCTPDGSETQTLPTKCWTEGDPSAAAKAATKFALAEGQNINTTDIKAHITSEHTAVAVAVDFFYQAWNHGLSTLPISRADLTAGIVRYPNATDVTESHKQKAGHAFVIVGWDDDLEYPQVDDKDQPVIGADGKPVMEKGFYIFKNSWGTDIFGVTSPYGQGYGVIAQRYIDDYGSAYVDTIPTAADQTPAGGDSPQPDPDPQPQPTTCTFSCAQYGFVANQCQSGWQCDAAGQCLTQTATGTCPM